MNPELIDKIESYIRGEIDYNALQEYAQEHRIENLDEKIDWVKSIPIAFEIEEVKAQIKSIVNKAESGPTPVISLSRRKWSIGIAASVFLVAALLWINRDSSDINSAFHFQDPGIPLVMSETENYPLYDALTYFGEANYDKTIEKLKALKDQSSDTIRYYLGASYYYNEQWDRAQPFLQDIASTTNSTFSQRAEWLLILLAVRKERISDAMNMLDKILQNTDHLFYDRALALQNELRVE